MTRTQLLASVVTWRGALPLSDLYHRELLDEIIPLLEAETPRVPPRLWCHARHFCHHWFEDRCSEACDRGEHEGGHGHEGCTDDWCELPPSGWWCSLKAGHEGPCPTRRTNEGIAS